MGTKVSQEIGIITVCAELQLDNCGDTDDVGGENIKKLRDFYKYQPYFLTKQLYFAPIINYVLSKLLAN